MEDKKISKDAEYTSLRQELLDSINACDVYNVAMYTITITALGAAFTLNNPPLFLLPYIVLFPFQRVINKKKDATIRLGAYISVYHECGEGWESNAFKYNAAMNKGVVKPKNESLLNKYAGRIGSVQLAILCSILCMIFSAMQLLKSVIWIEKAIPIVCLVLSPLLAYLAWKHNQWNKKLGSTKTAYIKQLKEMDSNKG